MKNNFDDELEAAKQDEMKYLNGSRGDHSHWPYMALIIGVVAFALWITIAPASASDKMTGYYATITKVSDGDTWWSIRDGETEARKYRGYLYDAPEPTQYGNALSKAHGL